MPRKNVIKQYVENQFYHVYNRGVKKDPIFYDDEDYRVFLNIKKRLFGPEIQHDFYGRDYPNFSDQIELSAYCLMPNHFHLLVYQQEKNSMEKLMKSLLIAYSMHFNKKYERVGPVFQSQYKASAITTDSYLYHISRYIHLNPKDFKNYEYSSLKFYVGNSSCDWLKIKRITDLFTDTQEYMEFLEGYSEYESTLHNIAGSYPVAG